MITAIQFVTNYQDFVNEIEEVIKPELIPALKYLNETDPHDLVRPDTYFDSTAAARGYVWILFLQGVRILKDKMQTVEN